MPRNDGDDNNNNDSSCSLFKDVHSSAERKSECDGSCTSLGGEGLGEEDDDDFMQVDDYEIVEEPPIIPVYNGKVLNISGDLMCAALSGISLKHYCGKCLPPEEPYMEEEADFNVGEDYYFEQSEEPVFGEEGEGYIYTKPQADKGSGMSSLIKLCYIPNTWTDSQSTENVPEGLSGFEERPPCVQERIHDRNSFWDLHQPELCKMTWPQDYVGETLVTEHLHRHLLRHGEICASFHEERDLFMMLNNELNNYGKLKEITSPRVLPPDDVSDRKKSWKGRGARHPCPPRPKVTEGTDWKDDTDLDPYQSLHVSKEEFCITIGRPPRAPSVIKFPCDVKPRQLWLPYGVEEFGYFDYEPCEEWGAESYQTYYVPEQEETSEESSCETPPQPQGWVEPDFCAMI